jgi:hypothetical protein
VNTRCPAPQARLERPAIIRRNDIREQAHPGSRIEMRPPTTDEAGRHPPGIERIDELSIEP